MSNLLINNQVITAKWPIQNDSLASISHNMAIIWGGHCRTFYVLWQFHPPSKYDPKIQE